MACEPTSVEPDGQTQAVHAPQNDAENQTGDVAVCELSPLELMAKRNKGMHSKMSCEYGQHFKTRPTDIFAVTYPKCGTTWMTQICHQLRSGGHTEFEEIAEVCPWDILAYDCGWDLNADHLFNPRVFKSHERVADIAKGGRYIHVCRDPEDAFVSFYHFLPAWAGVPPGQITVEEFASAVFGGVSHSGGIWDFYTEWWEKRDDPNVLWVCYEDLKSDLPFQLGRIAKFMGIELTDELLKIVLEYSSFSYMEAHKAQFDEHVVFGKVRDQMGIPSEYVFGDVSVSKVRSGKTGSKTEIPEEVSEMLRNRWDVSVKAKIGFSTYGELRDAVASLGKETA